MNWDLVVVADWSAASRPTGSRPRKDAIWVCADRGAEQDVRYFPTRAEALTWIDDLLSEGGRTLLGFDFAFGAPKGLAAHLTGRAEALALWDWLADRIEDGAQNATNHYDVATAINRGLPGMGPFWGRPAGWDLPDLPTRKSDRTDQPFDEHRAVEALAGAAKPIWQLAYAGAVGSQSLLGMAALAALRKRWGHDLQVWPQQTGFAVPTARIALTEIYPSLFPPDAAPIKDQGQVSATARALRNAPMDWFTAPAIIEDQDRVAREEGWILGVLPPPASDDCYALPAGVRWTPVADVLSDLKANTTCRVGQERVHIEDVQGRILAEPVRALRSHPPAANSAVDGYGFDHGTLGDGPIPLVADRAAAGTSAPAVPPGHAIRILTGAALPDGVDTVALQEDAEIIDGRLTLRAVPKPGANTRPAGEDIAAEDPILPSGRLLRPGDIALAIAGGHAALPVRHNLRVGVLSTGDEIVPPGGDGIADVNRPMLLAMLARWGLAPVDLGHVRDDAAALASALEGADVDAILTSGGASAGDEDHVSRLLRARGRVRHWRIAIKPGRPLMIGDWQGKTVFGLPGNPVAAFTCAALFARPALLQMAGVGWPELQPRPVAAAFEKRKKPGRVEVLRARLRDGQAEVFPSEGSGRVSGLSWAEGFVWLDDSARHVRPGDPVDYISFADIGLG
ncbi:MAG: molybdopterin-binding protein [Pseudomonadota bacterium]